MKVQAASRGTQAAFAPFPFKDRPHLVTVARASRGGPRRRPCHLVADSPRGCPLGQGPAGERRAGLQSRDESFGTWPPIRVALQAGQSRAGRGGRSKWGKARRAGQGGGRAVHQAAASGPPQGQEALRLFRT